MRSAPSEDAPHVPVMVDEVTGFLRDRGTVVDMTLGAGGHARGAAGSRRAAGHRHRSGPRSASTSRRRGLPPSAIASGPSRRRFSGVDRELTGRRGRRDPLRPRGQLDAARHRRARVRLSQRRSLGHADGRRDGPSAADLVNELPEPELADLIYEYGGEHRSRRIARAIVRKRPITTTDQLAGVIAGALGKRPGGPHPARRTFQALRIAVNRELEELAASLPRAVELLAPGGRVVVDRLPLPRGPDRQAMLP